MSRKTVFRLILALFGLSMLSACGSARNGTKLADTLFSAYCADCRFCLDTGEAPIEGTVHIEKNDDLTIDIKEPIPYEGICITTDRGGENERYTVDYDGVSIEVPKEILFRFGMLAAPFEDGFAAAVDALPPDAFNDGGTDENDDINTYFTYGNYNCGISFNGDTGIPRTISLCAVGTNATLTVLRFERTPDETVQESQ